MSTKNNIILIYKSCLRRVGCILHFPNCKFKFLIHFVEIKNSYMGSGAEHFGPILFPLNYF